MDMMQRKQQHLKFLKWIYLPKRVKEKKVKSLSRVQLFATPWTVAYQAPPSLGFSRQEYWSGLPFPSPGDLPDPEIESRSPALYRQTLYRLSHQGSQRGWIVPNTSSIFCVIHWVWKGKKWVWKCNLSIGAWKSRTDLCGTKIQNFPKPSTEYCLGTSMGYNHELVRNGESWTQATLHQDPQMFHFEGELP